MTRTARFATESNGYRGRAITVYCTLERCRHQQVVGGGYETRETAEAAHDAHNARFHQGGGK